jgi:hypothetical protein
MLRCLSYYFVDVVKNEGDGVWKKIGVVMVHASSRWYQRHQQKIDCAVLAEKKDRRHPA